MLQNLWTTSILLVLNSSSYFLYINISEFLSTKSKFSKYAWSRRTGCWVADFYADLAWLNSWMLRFEPAWLPWNVRWDLEKSSLHPLFILLSVGCWVEFGLCLRLFLREEACPHLATGDQLWGDREVLHQWASDLLHLRDAPAPDLLVQVIRMPKTNTMVRGQLSEIQTLTNVISL